VLWLTVAAAVVTAQSLWWFGFTLGGISRKSTRSAALAATLVSPSALGGALVLDVGIVDRNVGMACAGAALLGGCVMLYWVLRRGR
jgi:hypothetical protein